MKKNSVSMFILLGFAFFLVFSCVTTSSMADGIAEKTEDVSPPTFSPKVVTEYDNAVKDLTEKITIEEYFFDKEQILRKIAELDAIILDGNFEKWETYISPESKKYWSDKRNLNILSRMYSKKGVSFRNFPEYFSEYVVKSRLERKPDEIRYIQTNYVKVIEIHADKDIIFYEFIKNDQDEWLIRLRTLDDK